MSCNIPFVSNKRRRWGDAGVTSLEVALTFGIFILMAFGMIDVSRYFYSQQALTTLVAIEARQQYINEQTTNAFVNMTSLPLTLITTDFPLLDPTQVTSFTMCLGPPGDCPTGQNAATGVQVLSVSVTYNFTSFTPFLDALVGPITATMTYQY